MEIKRNKDTRNAYYIISCLFLYFESRIKSSLIHLSSTSLPTDSITHSVGYIPKDSLLCTLYKISSQKAWTDTYFFFQWGSFNNFNNPNLHSADAWTQHNSIICFILFVCTYSHNSHSNRYCNSYSLSFLILISIIYVVRSNFYKNWTRPHAPQVPPTKPMW